jgi:hypothetical protein
MSNLITIEGQDLADEIIQRIKGNKFIGIVGYKNGKIELLKSKINAEESVYFMTMAIQQIIADDCID